MGNTKSKSSKYDSYTVKGPPTRSNSDPSSIYYISQQQQQLSHKALKKQSKKSKKGKIGKLKHGSSNSVSLPSTSSSLTMLNDPHGEIIITNSSNNNYSSSSLTHSNNTSYRTSSSNRQYSNSQKQYKDDSSSSKPGSYLNLEEEFKKLDFNFDNDLTSSITQTYTNDTLKEKEDNSKRYTQYYGKNNEIKSPVPQYNNEPNESSYRKSSKHSDESLNKSISKSTREELRKSSKHSKEELRKSSRHTERERDLHRHPSSSSRHRHSKDELRKSSKHSRDDLRKSSKRNNEEIKRHNDYISNDPHRSLPVPSTVELNRLSKDVMDALALPSDSRDFISSLPNSQKWELIQKYYNANGNDSAEIYCISYTQKLKENPFDKEVISDIATALHTHMVSDIIDKFINYGGLHLLLSNLKQLEEDDKHYGPSYDEIESLYIQCIKAIMNHGVSL
ncbi:hypothetical protein BCR32DRAFT_155235 [Anaeromyces robustus]|uniref:Formin GTPase-binding domain-containing protein n=1 Tax=Anaeromyces robustus TaxID=1754192 RepID=A0A1Y1UZS1_9FUNG|nr:hypothetical protein BCR32DRAFT_155235 [Anaeromyces robustus]|eukprot:ORX43350.1 hypothetical protein BCR32DRAFT_155235 [Anaeromyces robustus]